MTKEHAINNQFLRENGLQEKVENINIHFCEFSGNISILHAIIKKLQMSKRKMKKIVSGWART